MKPIVFIFLLTGVLFSINSHAVLINNGGYTTDSESGLDWLDLTYTSNISYSNALMVAESIEDGGWTYATPEQVESLYSQIFTTYSQDDPTSWSDGSDRVSPWESVWDSTLTQAEQYFSLFGVNTLTYDPYVHHRKTHGLVGDAYSNVVTVYGVEAFDVWSSEQSDYINLLSDHWYGSDPDRTTPNHGTYLVRTTVVPLPPSILLFVTGLASLTTIFRYKNAKLILS